MPKSMRFFNILTRKLMTRDAEKKMLVKLGKLGEESFEVNHCQTKNKSIRVPVISYVGSCSTF